MFLEMVNKLIGEFFLAQYCLPSDFVPNGLSYTPLDELPVLLLRLAPLPAELA